VFWHIRLPSALPRTFGACKVAVTLAVVGAVIGEFVGADSVSATSFWCLF
jgi:NitT/TauT family transport system permease protein